MTTIDTEDFEISATDGIDSDGMPLAPKSAFKNAFVLFGPALNQATSWHPPTDREKELTLLLLSNWRLSTIHGPRKITTRKILRAADALGLLVCRVKTTKTENTASGVSKIVPDSYLLVYTKPGVKNYSGAFFMLRETRHSKVIIIGPHDDGDGTFASTKIGMSGSYALACISNGHDRDKVGIDRKLSDFVHSTENLGTFAVKHICRMFPNSVCMHIHGMTNDKKCLVRCRSSAMEQVFKTSVIDYTDLEINDFNSFNAFFTIDSLVNTNYYLKTEIPAVIHRTNVNIIKNIALDMEKNLWCWV